MNNSKQRNLILSIINESFNHPSAYDIYSKAKEVFPSISLGTVYRNLNLLYENNMIIKVSTGDGIEHYDKVNNKHSHFICNKCNAIYDVDKKIKCPSVVDDNKVLDYELNYFGVCNLCLVKEEL